MMIIEDKVYFNKVVEAFNIISSSTNDFLGFIKNHDFVYSAISNEFKKISRDSYHHIDEGKTDFDALASDEAQIIIPRIREYDNEIRVSLKQSSYLYVTNSLNNIFIMKKYPIINPKTGNFLGIRGEVSRFLFPHPIDALYNINGICGLTNIHSTENDDEIIHFSLTERQHMVLYLYTYRYSCTEIANLLKYFGFKMSAERVNDHLTSLKMIFMVKTKKELIEKAIALKYHLKIPKKFLKKGVYKIEDFVFII